MTRNLFALYYLRGQKMKATLFLVLGFFLSLVACNNPKEGTSEETAEPEATENETQAAESADSLLYPGEKHLKNIRQLTFGGENAEAYWSFDNKQLVFQHTNKEEGIPCDQIFYADAKAKTFVPHQVSTGKGRTTCAYFLPGDSLILYASTHLKGDSCPVNTYMQSSHQYVWPIYNSYDIFIADLEGNIVKQLTDNEFYDAEATISPKGDKIVFTSNRSGDIELYTMNLDGSDVKQVTDQLGYDGGAFFSPDGSQLVFRASRPKEGEEAEQYKDLLSKGLVAPSHMELFICNADGSDLRQVTHLGGANWAPFFHPSGEKIIFCSNYKSERGFPFNLYMVNVDGTGLEQLTFDDMFDSFPMYSPDGKMLVFCSNRNNGDTRNTNIFIADWVE